MVTKSLTKTCETLEAVLPLAYAFLLIKLASWSESPQYSIISKPKCQTLKQKEFKITLNFI